MARTVGFPVAVATALILKGEISRPGVYGPFTDDVYKPVLKHLQQHGIVFHDKSQKVPKR